MQGHSDPQQVQRSTLGQTLGVQMPASSGLAAFLPAQAVKPVELASCYGGPPMVDVRYLTHSSIGSTERVKERAAPSPYAP